MLCVLFGRYPRISVLSLGVFFTSTSKLEQYQVILTSSTNK